MSDSSVPKTWREAVSAIVWVILVFAAGFEGIVTLVHAEWISSIASFSIMVGLTAMFLHWQQLRGWMTAINPNWAVAAIITALAAIISWPFIVSQAVIPARPEGGVLNSRYTCEALSLDDQVTLRIALKNIQKPSTNFRIICLDNECRDLAYSFLSIFNGIGWVPFLDSKTNYNIPAGLVLYMNDINDHKLSDAIEIATKGKN